MPLTTESRPQVQVGMSSAALTPRSMSMASGNPTAHSCEGGPGWLEGEYNKEPRLIAHLEADCGRDAVAEDEVRPLWAPQDGDIVSGEAGDVPQLAAKGLQVMKTATVLHDHTMTAVRASGEIQK